MTSKLEMSKTSEDCSVVKSIRHVKFAQRPICTCVNACVTGWGGGAYFGGCVRVWDPLWPWNLYMSSIHVRALNSNAIDPNANQKLQKTRSGLLWRLRDFPFFFVQGNLVNTQPCSWSNQKLITFFCTCCQYLSQTCPSTSDCCGLFILQLQHRQEYIWRHDVCGAGTACTQTQRLYRRWSESNDWKIFLSWVIGLFRFIAKRYRVWYSMSA